jgi:hypothetical protein
MVLSKIDEVSSFDKTNGNQTWHLCSCIKKLIAFKLEGKVFKYYGKQGGELKI